MKKDILIQRLKAVRSTLAETGLRTLSHAKDDDEGTKARDQVDTLIEELEKEPAEAAAA